jgi:hypothetical protein
LSASAEKAVAGSSAPNASTARARREIFDMIDVSKVEQIRLSPQTGYRDWSYAAVQ